MSWDKQINFDGDTLADLAVQRLGRIADALEEIAELLRPRFIFHGLNSPEDIEKLKKAIEERLSSDDRLVPT